MKDVQINGLWFKSKSPSEYVYRDLPDIMIVYRPRTVRKKVITKTQTVRKLKTGQRRSRKQKYVIQTSTVREWLLVDGQTFEVFVSLTAACAHLRDALMTFHESDGEEVI